MHRLITHRAGYILALICLCLSGCDFSTPASLQTSGTLPPGLSVEEYALNDMPEVEPLTFEPATGTQPQVLSKRERERSRHFPDWSYLNGMLVSRGDSRLIASDKVTYIERAENGQQVSVPIASSVEVTRDGKLIYGSPLGAAGPIPSLWGLWAYADHWTLEVAHLTEKRSFDNNLDYDVRGEVIQDGIPLNRQHGYEESFGFQLIKGEPFYFFRKQGRLGISYADREIMLGYTQIPHDECCSASALNPKSAENMVAFFAQRDGVWYYVEIGVFE